MRRKASVTALAVAFAMGAVAIPPPVHADPGGPGSADGAASPAAAPTSGRVTLITGDRVTVLPGTKTDEPPHVRIEPGKGRTVSFSQRRFNGRLSVVPSDAQPLIDQGLLDERLFDVTRLLAWHYGDAHRDDIPVITQTSGKGTPAQLKAAEQSKVLPGLGMTAAEIPKAATAETWRSLSAGAGARTLASGITKLWLDGRRSFALDRSTAQIGAPTAWAQGLTGAGVNVVVLDSGYDANHPDLRDVVVQARNFDPDYPDARDDLGHGTHVASIVAGSGQASSGRYRGVAHGARLFIGKVGGPHGPRDSAILAGMSWAAVEVKAKVVNMSFGDLDTQEIDPLEHAVNTLTAQTGTLFVAAAGNGGPQSVGSPGSADAALTVGAVDSGDRLADFSSTGPRTGDKAIKPDVTAPGVDIVAANLDRGTQPPAAPYVSSSGTSMAAPHVTGAAAILAQRHPTWTAERLKAALIGSAVPTGGNGVFQQGAGRVDVARAVAQPVTALPGTLSTVLPHNTGPANKTVVYANSGDTPLTLDLAVEKSGSPPPQGLLSLSTRQVTVPAGGEASVSLTFDRAGAGIGVHAATLVARSGQVSVRTPVGAHVEPESHRLGVEAVAPDGSPGNGTAYAYNLATGEEQPILIRNGTGGARLPAGDWDLYAEFSIGRRPLDHTIAHVPVRVAAGTAPVVLDTRRRKEIRFSVDEPTAVPDFFQMWLANRRNGASWAKQLFFPFSGPDDRFFVLPVQQPGLGFTAWTTLYKQGVPYSPYRYDLVKHHDGGLPADPAYTARTADLAKVTALYRSAGTATGSASIILSSPAGRAAYYRETEVSLPSTVTHYRTPGPGFTWQSVFMDGQSWQSVGDTGRTLQRRDYTEVWNNAVAGPAPQAGDSARTGDELRYAPLSLFADGTPGRLAYDAGVGGTVTLARGGQVLARSEFNDCWDAADCTVRTRLAPEEAEYTLTTVARRGPESGSLSTAAETAWTFRSARTERATPLPLTTVRFTPLGLDDRNRAKRGSLTPIPMRIEPVPGAPAAAVSSLRVEASFDDGATWRQIPVVPGAHGTWTGFLLNPKVGDFVSLRAVAVDRAGTTVKQTITRAYALTP
ncbi:S8 family serine peptidase [Rhizohabitans arisaemae]|uniref:S8 family serine peptidase n=1 Tax=Rhizohabitans arisaemae TaxID=2720610 RepID=UPI0024B04204|nr:S8 family serine peptidase [Rhizohabitans arisaemae]